MPFYSLQNPRAPRRPGRLNFVQWCLIFVGSAGVELASPSPVWRPEFWDGSESFGKHASVYFDRFRELELYFALRTLRVEAVYCLVTIKLFYANREFGIKLLLTPTFRLLCESLWDVKLIEVTCDINRYRATYVCCVYCCHWHGKAFPLTDHEDSEGEMECSVSILPLAFDTTRTAQVSALRACGTLPPRKLLGTHFC